MIKAMLQREWIIVRSYRVAWFLLAAYVLTLFAGQFILRKVWPTLKSVSLQGLEGLAPNLTPHDLLGWVLGWGASFAMLFVVQMTAAEFDHQTLAQSIRSGVSRSHWVASKMLVAAIGSLMAGLAIAAVSLTFPDGSERWTDAFGTGILVALKYWGYAAMGLLATLLVRRALPTLVAFFLYGLMVEPLASEAISRIFGVSLLAYLPANLFSNIVPWPWSTAALSVNYNAAGLCLFYILLVYAGSIAVLKRIDL